MSASAGKQTLSMHQSGTSVILLRSIIFPSVIGSITLPNGNVMRRMTGSRNSLKGMVARGGIELPTRGFSVFKAKILCVSEIV